MSASKPSPKKPAAESKAKTDQSKANKNPAKDVKSKPGHREKDTKSAKPADRQD